MIGIITRLVTAPWFRYVGTAVIIVALFYGTYTKGFWDGEKSKEAAYQKIIQAERTRLIKQKREAERLAAEEIERLESVIDARTAELERLRNEALQDPNAHDRAIGPDSVRRLNGPN